jgi:predicted RNA-binding Zn-ribbon protein involved in translation (DUF1610 family)
MEDAAMVSKPFHRESMIALRATRQATHIARDVLYQPIDLQEMTCTRCGASIDWRNALPDFQIYCPSCGRLESVPCHLRPSVQRTRCESWDVEYGRLIEIRPEFPEIAPIWLVTFLAGCVALVVVIAIFARSIFG